MENSIFELPQEQFYEFWVAMVEIALVHNAYPSPSEK
jgi:hypothetical protein